MLRLAAATLLFFLFVVVCAPRPEPARLAAVRFPGAPLLLRALTGPFHTLAADRYWLLSARAGMAPGSVDGARYMSFMRAARLVVTLDPDFAPALRYMTTYLAALHRRIDSAHALCDLALRGDPAQAEPYLLKIVNEVGYRRPERRALVVRWIRQLAANTGGVPAWLPDLLARTRREQGRLALLRQDLQWLARNSRDPKERAAILARIAKLPGTGTGTGSQSGD